MSSLLLIEGVKSDAELRRELLQSVEQGAAHSEIKARVEAHESSKAATKKASELKAPDNETQARLSAVERGEPGSMSRGLQLTGPSKAEANSEALRAAQTLAAWVEHCDDKTYQKVSEICRRVLRGNLSR
jgi:hypothetical protein